MTSPASQFGHMKVMIPEPIVPYRETVVAPPPGWT